MPKSNHKTLFDQAKGYKELRHLVLNSADRCMAFNDYLSLIDAYGFNTEYAIDGTPRHRLDGRNTPFGPCEEGEFVGVALFLAERRGLSIGQLAHFLFECRPMTVDQVLCIVEDAAIIMDIYPEMEAAE